MSCHFHWGRWRIRSTPLMALADSPQCEVIAERTDGTRRRRVKLKGGFDLRTAMDETVARLLSVLEEADKPRPATRRNRKVMSE